MLTGKIFLAERDIKAWIVLGIILAGFFSFRKYLKSVDLPPQTDPNYEAASRMFMFLLMCYLIFLAALGVFAFWYLFIRTRFIIVDAENHFVYFVSAWFVRDAYIGLIRMLCHGETRHAFILHNPMTYKSRRFYYLPFKGQTFIDFAVTLSDAGSGIICKNCKHPCSLPKGTNIYRAHRNQP